MTDTSKEPTLREELDDFLTVELPAFYAALDQDRREREEAGR